MNKFSVSGRLKEDPVINELENGSKVVNIVVAVDRDYRDKEGNPITDFLHYSLWNKDAERIAKLSKKGALIHLEGHYISKNIEGKNGPIPVMQPVVDLYKHIENVKREVNEKEEQKEEKEMGK